MDMRLVLVKDTFPEIMAGAPCPMVFANEHVVHLSYYDINGDVALVKFEHCFEFKMGMPGEDQISKSPYSDLGLINFEAHTVVNSPWLNELESRYRVISDFSRGEREYVHYIFAFHDRTFECISSGFSVQKHTETTVKLVLMDKAWGDASGY